MSRLPRVRSAACLAGVISLSLLVAEGEAFAQQPYQVKNIRAGAAGSIGAGSGIWSAALGSTLVFAADDGSGVALWKSDGSSGGTSVLASGVAPGSATPPGGLDQGQVDPAPSLGGFTFFHGKSGGLHGVWKTDGTMAGTTLVSTTPGAFARGTLSNGKILFAGGSGALWVTDGTSQNTKIVSSFFGTQNIVDLGGVAISTSSVGAGYRIYKTDGASASLIAASPANSVLAGGPSVRIGASALFVGNGGLWKSDGTESGTSVVTASVVAARDFATMNGTLFFRGNNDLWKSDGTPGGTALVKAVNAEELVAIGNTLYFVVGGDELWKSDGTGVGTVLVKAFSSSVEHLTAFGGALYFSADGGGDGAELWTSDGSAQGTVLVADIAAGGVSSAPSMFRVVGNTLFFSADDGTTGRELWALSAPAVDGGAGDAGQGGDASIDASPNVDGGPADASTSMDGGVVVDASGPGDAGADAATTDASTPTNGPSNGNGNDAAAGANAAGAGNGETSDGCGCTVPGVSAHPGLGLFVVAALALRRATRRRRTSGGGA